MPLTNRLLFKLRWLRWKNQQMDSIALRRFFRDTHDIDVGLYSYGCFDRWRMPGPLRIGRYCSFGSSVRVVDSNHPMDGITTHPLIYDARHTVVPADRLDAVPLIISDDVWVGHNSVILPGCKHIGRGAIIGAGSIVTRDVPAYAVMAGNPARQLRMRFADDMIAALEASQWWTRSMAELAAAERDTGVVTTPSPRLLTALGVQSGAEYL